MKVICIDNGELINAVGRRVVAPQLTEGNTYTVIARTRYDGYELLEATPFSEFTGFMKERFIPTSQIDETEFKRNYKTQTA